MRPTTLTATLLLLTLVIAPTCAVPHPLIIGSHIYINSTSMFAPVPSDTDTTTHDASTTEETPFPEEYPMPPEDFMYDDRDTPTPPTAQFSPSRTSSRSHTSEYTSPHKSPSFQNMKRPHSPLPSSSRPPPPPPPLSPSPSPSPKPKRSLPTARRVYSTNVLPGFRRNAPSLFPPGLGGRDARKRVLVDVGANNGDAYTLMAHNHGHPVIAFEASPRVAENFRSLIHSYDAPLGLGVVHNKSGKPRVRFTPPDDGGGAPIWLANVALSDATGSLPFYQAGCSCPSKCGKTNRVVEPTKANVYVPRVRLDAVRLPVPADRVWMLKVDVGGHERAVLAGARGMFAKVRVPWVAVEFSPSGRYGVAWGINLLDELHRSGYTCFHLRGFGRCHDETLRSPSLKCNFPFDVDAVNTAPTFEEYAEVFRVRTKGDMRKHRMADLMCRRRGK